MDQACPHALALEVSTKAVRAMLVAIEARRAELGRLLARALLGGELAAELAAEKGALTEAYTALLEAAAARELGRHAGP